MYLYRINKEKRKLFHIVKWRVRSIEKKEL